MRCNTIRSHLKRFWRNTLLQHGLKKVTNLWDQIFSNIVLMRVVRYRWTGHDAALQKKDYILGDIPSTIVKFQKLQSYLMLVLHQEKPVFNDTLTSDFYFELCTGNYFDMASERAKNCWSSKVLFTYWRNSQWATCETLMHLLSYCLFA